MKNIFKTLLVMIFALNMSVAYADDSFNKKTTVEVEAYIGNIENFKCSTAELALYNKDNECLGVLNLFIDATNVKKTLTFIVDEYAAGEEFYLLCLNNADCIEYNSEFYGVGSKILLKTFSDYYDEKGQIVKGNKFNLTLYPLEQQKITFLHNSKEYITDHPIKLVNSDCMISLVDIMNIFDLWQDKTVFDSLTGRLEINVDDKNVVLTLDEQEASAKEAVVLTTAPLRINTLMYVPLRFTAEALGAEVVATYENGSLIVDIVTIETKFPEKDIFINSKNISSKTNYLIWIDKSDFAVTVFEGSQNNWRAINSYPCSIGAPKTPTITGQFEYFSKEKRWSYPQYYCGPVMRFYNGYALHSTLVRYDGTDYDPRLGMMISHGCIRMKPQDIQYMWDTIPLYTKVYVTE